MSNGKIYAIMGKSCVGKDTILNRLVKDGFQRVVSHTTRPKRSNEINDRDYHFVNLGTMLGMIDDECFVEIKTYDVIDKVTKKPTDTWYYGIAKDEIDINSGKKYIAVVDDVGLKGLQDYYGKENVVGIYLYVKGRERLLRALNRCEIDDTGALEICRRYLADEKQFTNEVINQCILKINNLDVDETIDIIHRNIKNGL